MLLLTSRFAIVLLLGALTAACGSAPPEPSSRYTLAQDRAPSRAMDPDSIPDVIPGPVRRTGAGNRSPYTVLGRTFTVLPTEEGYSARGVASWYGEKFHGHKTSNGEIFDMYKVSAAHTSLPIPSFLRVTNLENNRSIVVRVNDRGPFHGDRIIDLSYAAAVKLGYADRGTARVQLKALAGSDLRSTGPTHASPVHAADTSASSSTQSADTPAASVGATHASPKRFPQPPPQPAPADPLEAEQMAAALARTPEQPQAGGLYLQVGAFSGFSAAQDLSRRVQSLTIRPVFIRSVETVNRGVLHRVRVGPVNGPEEARQLTLLLVAADLGSPYTVSE